MNVRKIFNRLKDQSGRSFVEVLGVLAIVGILSMMGIWGLSYAMEKNRENETLNRFSKVVAGARTSRILQNLGDATQYDETGNFLPEYEPQSVNMHDVISNIGNDINDDYIIAPLEGPVKDGTEKPVEIYVYVETPEAFTVHADNLTKEACKKIVRANLGYSFTYEAKENTDKWRVPALTQTDDGAELFCDQIATGQDAILSSYFNPFIRQAMAQTNNKKGGTLVMWFGPYDCIGKECMPPSCQGAECCCETIGTKVTLKDPAPIGCAPAQGGKCADCAELDSNGICGPKIGVNTCETCAVSLCPNQDKSYYCGKGLCCADASACGDGVCKDVPTTPDCKEPRPTVCGKQCCSADEDCINEKCEPKKTGCSPNETACFDQKGTFTDCCSPWEKCSYEGKCGAGDIDCGTNDACGAPDERKCCKPDEQCVENKCIQDKCPAPSNYWCVKDKVCCPVTQGCNLDTKKCIANNCAETEITCGDSCCNKKTEVCHPGYSQGINGSVVPPFCQRAEECYGIMCLDGCCGPNVFRCGADGRCPWAIGGGGNKCPEPCPKDRPVQCGDCSCCREDEICV